eukprot:scaffold200563_cov39-Tisochrysis_lutea.AAC.4
MGEGCTEHLPKRKSITSPLNAPPASSDGSVGWKASDTRQHESCNVLSALAGSSCLRMTDHVQSIDSESSQSLRSRGPYAAAMTEPEAFQATAVQDSSTCTAMLEGMQADDLVVLVLPTHIILVKNVGSQVALECVLELRCARKQERVELGRLHEVVARKRDPLLLARFLCLKATLLRTWSLRALSAGLDGAGRALCVEHWRIRLPARRDICIARIPEVSEVRGQKLLVDAHRDRLWEAGRGRGSAEPPAPPLHSNSLVVFT